jgi:MFS family permease
MIIVIHIAAMHLPAPLSGWIVDRYGSTPAAVLARAVLLAASLTAALTPGTSLVALAIELAMLGAGWNIGLLSGTTALAGALDPATRARTHGRVGVAVALGGAARRIRLRPHGRHQ